MAKLRVYELAKVLGVESKTILTVLKDMGEFVRSAASPVEPPVERRLRRWLQEHPQDRRSQSRPPQPARREPCPAPDRRAAAGPAHLQRQIELDFPAVGSRGRRHRGPVTPLVQMMLDQDGVVGAPFVDQYEAASARARTWVDGMFEVSQVRAWFAVGVTDASTAGMFAAKGITAELSQARPWHTVAHDPTKPTILQRVLGGATSRRPEALRDAVAHLRLSGLLPETAGWATRRA